MQGQHCQSREIAHEKEGKRLPPSGFERLAAKLLVEERFLAIEREESVDTDEVRRRAARRMQNHPDATSLFFRHVIDKVADEMDTEPAPQRPLREDVARL